MILVSACLAGKKCKYSGESNDFAAVRRFLADKEYIIFCPETLGGLAIPRSPVELLPDGRAVGRDGVDVTAAFRRGAQLSLALAEKYQPELILLKEGSPSCGVHFIYDGTFTHTRIDASGYTAAVLRQAGYRVISEADL